MTLITYIKKERGSYDKSNIISQAKQVFSQGLQV